jgi:hypothetical protein
MGQSPFRLPWSLLRRSADEWSVCTVVGGHQAVLLMLNTTLYSGDETIRQSRDLQIDVS